jgi:hypothetical protein
MTQFAAAARDSVIRADMPQVARRTKTNPQSPYPVWKAAAVKACLRVHERAAAVTRESIWSRADIMQMSPAEVAEIAAREYDSTHSAIWVKRRP